VVFIFALLGAWLSAAYMPSLLDVIFVAVERANMQPSPGVPPSGTSVRKPPNPKPMNGEQSGAATGGEQGPTTGGEQPATTGDAQPTSTTGDQSTASTSGGGERNSPSSENIEKIEKTDVERSTEYPGSSNPIILAAMALLGAIVGGAFGNVAYGLWRKWIDKWDEMEVGDKVSLFVGLFAGIVASFPFLFAFQGLGGVAAPLLTLGLVLGFSALSILALKSMEEVLPWNRNRPTGRRTGKKILDTNVIIDGRILDVARTGFLEGDVYVPKFVIDELQHIADSSDALRRQRGRRGLEILRLLQTDHGLKVGTEDGLVDSNGEVDDRLVKLAKALGGDLVSNDFNLNKVAGLQNVRVLNINDLALSLRPNVLPGEHLLVAILREGNQPGQGVGYLDDGTMVVVEHGKVHIGETVNTTVSQVIQTERGKMIFAERPETIETTRERSGR
jgi:uncharacterized protein YacL